MGIKKEDAIKILISLRNEQNQTKIDKYIEKVSCMDELSWEKFIEESSINTIEDLIKKARELTEENDEMIELNDLVKYGFKRTTIHIHVVPSDVHNMLSREGLKIAKQKLIDALEKIQQLLKENEKLKDVENVYAVSSILRKPIINIFEDLNYEIKVLKGEEAKKDEELRFFYETMFKGSKMLGRASISKEKLFSEKWNELKNSQKVQIEFNNGEERE